MGQHVAPAAARPAKWRAGFTMIEMLVVLTIVLILTAAVVGNYGSYRSATVATNMAYEAATTVRQAQLYGLGVRGVQTEAGYEFGGTYGVEFADESPTYSIFRDREPANGYCDDGCDCADSGSECVEQVRMLQQVSVIGLCAAQNANLDTSDLLAGSYCAHGAMTVSFTRPNPEGTIRAGAPGSVSGDYAIAGIVIRGGTHCRLVRVYSNGQIAVEGLSADDVNGTIFENECPAA